MNVFISRFDHKTTVGPLFRNLEVKYIQCKPIVLLCYKSTSLCWLPNVLPLALTKQNIRVERAPWKLTWLHEWKNYWSFLAADICHMMTVLFTAHSAEYRRGILRHGTFSAVIYKHTSTLKGRQWHTYPPCSRSVLPYMQVWENCDQKYL